MTRLLALTAAAVLTLTAPAFANTADDAVRPHFAAAEAYWHATPECRDGVEVSYDEAFVAPMAAKAFRPPAGLKRSAPGEAPVFEYRCFISVGDWYLAAPPEDQCRIIVHEWGHLLGHHDGETGLSDDPLEMMVEPAMTPECATLIPPAAPAPVEQTPQPPVEDPAAVATWQAHDKAYTAWATRMQARFSCKSRADSLARRKARVTARRRCVRRYGAIYRTPATPAMPRPASVPALG